MKKIKKDIPLFLIGILFMPVLAICSGIMEHYFFPQTDFALYAICISGTILTVIIIYDIFFGKVSDCPDA